MMSWESIKSKLLWVLGGIGVVLGGLLTVLTLGQFKRRGLPPPRPELEDVPDVEVPDVKTDLDTDFNTAPADDFDKEKAEVHDDVNKDVAEVNKRFGTPRSQRPKSGVRGGRR